VKQCPELKTHRIAWLGLDTVHAPYRRVRLAPSGSFLLATLAGEGRVLLEGKWARVTAGSLCMAPPRVLNAFHAVPGKRWDFAWVRYEEPSWLKPLVGAASPLLVKQGAFEIGRALAGLRDEWSGDRDPSQVHHWVSLVHGLARRSARPWRSDSRIGALWETVGRELATDWKLPTLAARCAVSAEHLRRICRRELGRTPMEHLTYIRVQRAQELLENSDGKLEAIAAQVGYHSGTVFARAFIRCVGLTPSQFRERGAKR
jgi:AraC-like DNA-binding protein